MIEPEITTAECGAEKIEENYTAFLRSIKSINPELFKHIVQDAKLSHRHFHAMMNELRLKQPAVLRQVKRIIRAGDKFKSDQTKEILRRQANDLMAWIEKHYSCSKGIVTTAITRPVTVRLKIDRPVIGLPKEIMRQSHYLAKEYGGKRKWTFGFDNRAFVSDLTPDAIAEMRKNPLVESVEEGPEARIMSNEIPDYNPAAVNTDWGVDRVHPTYAWAKSLYGNGIKVAVIDTGIKSSHECFWKDGVCVYKGGYNFVAGNDDPEDDHDHGTYCCGIVAAQHNEIVGSYKGIAPGIELYAVKVLDAKGSGSFDNVTAGIDWARTNGMDVISLSLGGTASLDILQQACDAAWYSGILILAAAGNEGPGDNTVCWPARYMSCVAVAAVDYDEYVASFSSRGPEVELSAPGRYIVGPWAGFTYNDYVVEGSGDRYMCASGTSAATPHVAAAAALIKNWYPLATNLQIREWLAEYARDL